MTQHLEKIIHIKASPSIVWDTLTNPEVMKQWMGEPEMKIEIITNWKVGTPIVIKGFHHVKFENTGTVLQFEPDRILKYDYLSSISRLPNIPENHTIIEFRLAPSENQTTLTLTLSNFPTESIYKHINFYWTTTIETLRDWIERDN
ncbi:MAG TPA: SRPBCC domain-containing protein [Cyclobacteriaceae bacterium]|jgi:uncharacterized protein YndB with AHSA1/START domain|nr:SRPBCC domain-containing protein [Cyclobacteriaceae bacterium]